MQALTLDQSWTSYCLSKDENRRPLFSEFIHHFSSVQTSHALSNFSNSKQRSRVDPPLFLPSYTIWSDNVWDFWAQSSCLQSLLQVFGFVLFCIQYDVDSLSFFFSFLFFCIQYDAVFNSDYLVLFSILLFLAFLIQIVLKISI